MFSATKTISQSATSFLHSNLLRGGWLFSKLYDILQQRRFMSDAAMRDLDWVLDLNAAVRDQISRTPRTTEDRTEAIALIKKYRQPFV